MWDSGYKGANITLSNGDKTFIVDLTNYNATRGTVFKSSGKLYFELYIDDEVAGQGYHGICTNQMATNTYVGALTSGWSLDGQSVLRHGGSTASDLGLNDGNVLGVAVDLDNGYVWFAVNNVWVNSGNPGTGANPAFTDSDISSNDIYPAGSGYAAGNSATIRGSLGEFTYSPPSGFSAWIS